ncbi:MAG: hypothetical protein JXQ68_02980 [Campylobacterales bacterium]|nr:hypothetical protein [Campylobacterales bacterium]
MHTIKIDVSDTLYEKVMTFLKQLPQNSIKLHEEKKISSDFIEELVKHPIKLSRDTKFLTKDEIHTR